MVRMKISVESTVLVIGKARPVRKNRAEAFHSKECAQ